MNVTCPTCKRGTDIDSELGDFPVRCQRCGGMLRCSCEGGPEGTARGMPLRPVGRPAAAGARRIQRGALAGLLISRPEEIDPPVIHANGGAVAMAAVDMPAARQRILRPESRKEIARAHARQQALRRAELRGSYQALGALGWAGLAFVTVIAISAMVLQAQAMSTHRMAFHADTLHASQN